MYILFYNPISRSGNGEQSLSEVIELIETTNYKSVNVLEVKNWDTLGEFYDEEDVFVVIGGDGTLSKFINLTKGLNQKILFYAGGTGNDFMRNFENQLIEYSSEIDKPMCENGETRKVINSFGTGIDTQVLEYYDNAKRHNKVTYIMSTLRSFLTYKPSKVSVEIDGVMKEFDKTYLVAVQNGKYFGGGMMVAPDSEVNSGVLDVVVVHSVSRLKLFFVFPKIYKGTHVKLTKHVFYGQGKEIKIKREIAQPYSTDGEKGDKVCNDFRITV